MVKKVRYFIYLRDVLILALSAFGGPQAHIAMLFELMVNKRGYLKEQELIELNALCQILPGPTSTQTITAIGFKIGGPNLAYLTLLVWVLPAVLIMTSAGLMIDYFQDQNISLNFTRYIQPMAVAFVAYAAYKISVKVVHTKTGIALMIVSAVVAYGVASPFTFPLILLVAGAISAIKYKGHEKEDKTGLNIKWANFVLWALVFLGAALLGALTKDIGAAKPIRLFENFYRNGSLIFGGGQVLIPFLYTEFVELKGYLTQEEFLSGYAFVQALPGPVFSFCAYVGSLSMRDFGIGGQIFGSMMASFGIFLPGTFLIFFVIRFWDGLKKYRIVKASLEGISAASCGMVVTAAIRMYEPVHGNPINIAIIIGTFSLLMWTKTPPPLIIFAGILAGFIF